MISFCSHSSSLHFNVTSPRILFIIELRLSLVTFHPVNDVTKFSRTFSLEMICHRPTFLTAISAHSFLSPARILRKQLDLHMSRTFCHGSLRDSCPRIWWRLPSRIDWLSQWSNLLMNSSWCVAANIESRSEYESTESTRIVSCSTSRLLTFTRVCRPLSVSFLWYFHKLSL